MDSRDGEGAADRPATWRRTSSLRFIPVSRNTATDAAGQIAGESIVETAADQQVRGARLAVIDPVEQGLLVARLPLGFEL